MRPDRDEFVSRFGGIYEHSAWVAESTFDRADGLSAEELADLFANCVDVAPYEQKLALIRAHPDLAGKAAVAGELSHRGQCDQARKQKDPLEPAHRALLSAPTSLRERPPEFNPVHP